MKITIDEKTCLKHKLTLQELLISIAIRAGNFENVVNNLVAREVLVKNNTYKVTQHWSEVIDEILCDSSGNCTRTDEELGELAVKVKNCFPEGKMRDRFGRETSYYYRCNKSEVAKALKRFFAQFGSYPDDDIIDATKRYVASFKGNYANMRLAKYFIIKNLVKQGENGNGYVEQVSDLLTFLENKESEGEEVVTNSDDWLVSARN